MTIVAAEEWHIDAIAADVRRADARELWSGSRSTPAEAMRYGMRFSGAWTGMHRGDPVCMFGVTPYSILSSEGIPWMVSTNVMDQLAVQKRLLIESRLAFSGMQSRWRLLFNVVDDQNESAKRWLRWLGFTLSPAAPYGPDGTPFSLFYWSRP